jgi:hypothetical protein
VKQAVPARPAPGVFDCGLELPPARTSRVKATVVKGWDVRPTLERLAARSGDQIVCKRLITATGPDPAPLAAYSRASPEPAGQPVAVRVK